MKFMATFTLLGHRIKRMLLLYDWEIVEVQGAILKIAWGIWLILPMQTFATSQVYSGLAAVTRNEDVWGTFLILLGISHFVGVAVGGKWRRRFVMLAAMFWLFSSISFFIARPGTILAPLAFVIFIFMGINYIRIGLPHFVDRRFKPGELADRKDQTANERAIL